MLPLLLGVTPFGLLLGSVVAASANPLAGWSAALPIYGGSAHLATLEPLARGSTALAAAGIGILVNLRVAVYAAALAPLWRGSRWWVRVLGALTTIDQTWIVADHRARSEGSLQQRRAHYFGASALLSTGWVFAVTAGAVSASVDAVAPLFAVILPVSLGYLVMPHLKRPGGVAAIVAASLAFVLVHPLVPPGTDLPAAMAAGAAGGCAFGLPRKGT
jgi:predicted branched-subunit amino acid permease